MGMRGVAVTGLRPLPQQSARAIEAPGISRGAPTMGDARFAGMGLEALAALLVSDSARTNGKLMRDLQRDAKQAQAAALDRQVEALHEKASDMVSEAIVSGAITAAGGALTIASVAAGPSPSDAGKAAQWENAAAAHPSTNVSVVAAECKATLAKQTAAQMALVNGGTAVTGLATPLAKGTYGAQQALDDAAATRAAAEAKFAESSKDEYGALAREFDAGSGKALQILQSMVTERHAVRRGLLQRA